MSKSKDGLFKCIFKSVDNIVDNVTDGVKDVKKAKINSNEKIIFKEIDLKYQLLKGGAIVVGFTFDKLTGKITEAVKLKKEYLDPVRDELDVYDVILKEEEVKEKRLDDILKDQEDFSNRMDNEIENLINLINNKNKGEIL